MKQIILCALLALAATALDNGQGKTPQMGWNSWNHFGCGINETIIMQAADAMISSGLNALGYEYLNMDDCWADYRDANGTIHPNSTYFPSGIKALADYVHGKGLKFGLYSDSGALTCDQRPGSRHHEVIDANTYASWGIDYLKFDNCYALYNETPEYRYPIMRDALLATGAPIFFSMCEWGVDQPWLWASKVGNSWRTDIDIADNWESMLRVVDNQVGLAPFAGPGGWNDPDMMEVGNGGMTDTEYRTHFALWCLLKAPLIIGCDMATVSNATLAILGAKELIAVNQDPLGVQGDVVYQVGLIQIWAGPLADGSRAFLLFNRGTTASPYSTSITLDFVLLGFPESTTGLIRDLYAESDVGNFTGTFTVEVAPHGVFAGRFWPESYDVTKQYMNWRPWA